MDKLEMKAAVEAILYVYGDEIAVHELAEVLEQPEILVTQVLREMSDEKRARDDGIQLVFLNDKVQLTTNEKYSGYIEKLMDPVRRPQTLSRAAIETLAVIAYNQPVTKQEVEAVRGVMCDYSISSLLDKGLIYISGRRDTIGKPMLYCTNEEFLRHFGISSISELPHIEQDEELVT